MYVFLRLSHFILRINTQTGCSIFHAVHTVLKNEESIFSSITSSSVRLPYRQVMYIRPRFGQKICLARKQNNNCKGRLTVMLLLSHLWLFLLQTSPEYPGLLLVHIHNRFNCEFYWHYSKTGEYFFKFQCCVLG